MTIALVLALAAAMAGQDLPGRDARLKVDEQARSSLPAPTKGPAVWRIQGAGGAVTTLFGAFHALPEGTSWRTPALDAAIAEAQVVAFEVHGAPDPATTSLDRALATEAPLSSKLSPEGGVRLKATAKAFGMDFARLDRTEPWLATTILTATVLRETRLPRRVGVEGQIAASLAPDVRTTGLEAPGEATDLLRRAPEAAQLAALETLLASVNRDVRADDDRGLALWLNGDVKGMEAMTAESSQGKRDVMLWARNRLWLARLETLLNGRENALIVVGAAHMLGPDGLPAILRARGYIVEGP